MRTVRTRRTQEAGAWTSTTLESGLLNQAAEIFVNNAPDDLPDVTVYGDDGERVATEDETMDVEVDGEQEE